MKIAIAATENHVKSYVDPHFGRCDWYCIYDTETKKAEFIENIGRNQHEKAGCDAVGFLADKGISLAIAGRFGSKVVEAFRAKDIQMIVPENSRIIKEIINQFK
ncbi:MAG TPA: NifB/NifX family molybdenum-iron cluster-binding protein [Bacteroidales bacterium]|nr:NifB/NifX family molybdenum-iron cluster-binding protein [Bacteroidales bacterium]